MRLLMFLLGLFIFGVSAELSVIKKNETTITTNAFEWRDSRYGNLYLNSLSFQQDALITYNGFQYAAFYSSNRYVTLARRAISSESWESFEFTDYKQEVNDNHNSISIGISPADGRIHVCFDHHTSVLNYRISDAGLLNSPQTFTWNQSLFSEVKNDLAGETVTDVTYPRFITAPDSTLVLTVRIGVSGHSDNKIWKYKNDGTWQNLGQFIEGDYNGGNCTAYFHGLRFDKNNRLYAVWCWREDGSGEMNHDLMFAYSDDYGDIWHNNLGGIVARAGKIFINQDSVSCKVWTIPTSTGLINQESMTVDKQGRVHVLSRENVAGKNVQMHYFRDTIGTWHRVNTNIPTKIWDNRSSIGCDGSGNVYAVMPHISIAGASANSGYTDWRVLATQDEGRFYYSEPQIDVVDYSDFSSLYIFSQKGLGELAGWKNIANTAIGPNVMSVNKSAYVESKTTDWTDYNFSFNLTIKEVAAGVCFRVKDSSNMYMWQLNASTGLLRFHVKKDGVWTVKKETQYDFVINTEYQVTMLAEGTKFTCILDGQRADSVTDESFVNGGIGFRSGRTESFIIDNVSVSSDSVLFTDSFTEKASLTSPNISCLEYQLNGPVVPIEKKYRSKNSINGKLLTNAFISKFKKQSTISLDLSESADLSISIFTTNGVLVKQLMTRSEQKGKHLIVWDNRQNAPGAYLIRIRVQSRTGRSEELLLQDTKLF
ncbi:MAG: hypothetical protein GX639_11055 [Fibrobacter sp.]|nr:hypothetical protein [Fibrobacter sp.]